ncbi:ankyrin repeat-containing protein ITN1-like [Hevea brasiliensis]|uniref:ankyrin repeat-containing protein ITN1-like n=1 Tax=Hevea brasiliensis TaxID=3981 RepID=UPI0025DFB364|nr:ankyrin repeat-containing protein ITN1-like [Hevea brasiliensis]
MVPRASELPPKAHFEPNRQVKEFKDMLKLKKEYEFVWLDKHQVAFEKIKQYLTKPLMLMPRDERVPRPKATAATLAPATGNANASRQENTEPKAKVTIVDPIQDAAAAPKPRDRAPQSQASSLSDAMASAPTAFKIAEDPAIGPKATAAAFPSATENANASRQENTKLKAKVTIADPIQDAAGAPQPRDRVPQSQASSLSDAMASAPTAFKIAEDPAIGPKATAATLASAIRSANVSRQENTKLKAKVTIADPIQDAAAALQPRDRVPPSQDPATEPEEHGNTAFCYAALSGNVKIAQIMKMKKQDLSVTRGGKNLFPIHIAALAGHAQMVHELYDEDHIKNQLTNDDRISLLIALVESDIYDVALKMIERHPELATMNDHTREEETALHAFARKPCIPSIETSTGIWSCRKNFYLFFSVAGSNISKHEQGLELVQKLWEKVIMQDEEKVSKFMIIPSGRLIFIAAENGNVEFLTILIRQYPALILKVDENKHTIFHKDVLYRHEKIFKLIFELGMMKNLINIYEDENKNNMLHLAGQLPLPSRLNVVPGAALQLQQELLWFEEVKKVVRPGQIVAKNTQKQTAREVFMEKHENLRIAAEKWMIKTANSCMLVATLIATVTFAAAFTLPGGNGQDNGFPVFLNRTLFKIFAIADAVSLAFSSSSILSFLSILTSSFSMDDFLKSLPNKLIRGFLFLFIAIITMMGAFVLAFF